VEEDLVYNIESSIEDMIQDLETITKMHTRLDELSTQLSDVVHLASLHSEGRLMRKSSSKLMELVNVLLNKVELGINNLEKNVISIEDIRNRLQS
jgi:hypothetical protein